MIYPDVYINQAIDWLLQFSAANPKTMMLIGAAIAWMGKAFPGIGKAIAWAKQWMRKLKGTS